jgi:hypothetical protein
MQPKGRPTLKSYQAAQWTAFAFGLLGKSGHAFSIFSPLMKMFGLAMLLALTFFRGVGIVGHQKLEPSETGGVSESDHEQTAVDPILDEPWNRL